MTAPVHAVKHLKSEYRRYQIMAVVSALITIVVVFLSAITSYQLSHISKSRDENASKTQNRAEEALSRETGALKKQLADIENQLNIEKETNQQLQLKIVALQKQITEIKTAPAPVEEKSSSQNVAPAVTPQPAADSKPIQGWKPSTAPPTSAGDKTPQRPVPTSKPAPEPAVKKPASVEKPAPKATAPAKPPVEKAPAVDSSNPPAIPAGAESKVVEQETKSGSDAPPLSPAPAAEEAEPAPAQ